MASNENATSELNNELDAIVNAAKSSYAYDPWLRAVVARAVVRHAITPRIGEVLAQIINQPKLNVSNDD